MTYQNTLDFAKQLDKEDSLAHFRERFYHPKKEGKEIIYFIGNSLGLQPTTVGKWVNEELQVWAEMGVEGHFASKNPWADYHKILKSGLAHVAGALESEVTAMNSLTANLHFLMVSFYKPIARRKKILIETKPFSSDQYAFDSQVRFHKLNPDDVIIELKPREGEHTLRTEDILQIIANTGEELALVILGGVNYYTGQLFDMQTITKAAHQVGAYVGFDLAHAIGNAVLNLHDWKTDFAVWCSYKYLNSGPGGIGGVFVHEMHHENKTLPRLEGWWGYDEKTRFQMNKVFVPQPDVDAWSLSNVPVLLLAAHKASLEIFEEAGIQNLRKKSEDLTGFLYFLVERIAKELNYGIEILTPSNSSERGCQLSLQVAKEGKQLFEQLSASVLIDWREPNVIRVAPAPLYNTFEEVYKFGELLRESIINIKGI